VGSSEKEGIAVKVFGKSVFARIDVRQFIRTVREDVDLAKKLLEEHEVWVMRAGAEFGVEVLGFYLVNVARQSDDSCAGVGKLLQELQN
jgi:bifunctional pyridoxal-dependent enzyme with beta-cystathionase and maltose regulon repressor activities